MVRIGLMVGSIFMLFGSAVGSVPTAKAEILEVISSDINDINKVDLAEGELGDLTIYLKSFGDEMDGYGVYLIDDLDRQVAFEHSTGVGIVRFSGIPPGRYRIRVELKRSVRGVRDPVTVGDMRLVKIPGLVKSKK